MRNAISEQKLARLIAENATLALFVMDARQHCAFMNTAAEELTGFSRQEVVDADRPLHDLIHHHRPDGSHYPIEECPIDRALPGRARTRGEDVFIRKDGSMVPVAFTASPIVEDGLPVGTVIEVRDLTADREVARALRERDERYEFLAETVPVQIWTALPDGTIDYVTQQTASQFGLTPDRILRDGWLSVLHPDDVEPTVARWKQSLATGAPYELEFRLRMADGAYATHLARAVPQRGPDGAIVRWFGTNTNIEEQKEERRRISALLEEVDAQAKDSARALIALRTERDEARGRAAELEAEVAARRGG